MSATCRLDRALQKTLVTAQQLLEPPYLGMRWELIEGETIELLPAGDFHGDVGCRMNGLLRLHVKHACREEWSQQRPAFSWAAIRIPSAPLM